MKNKKASHVGFILSFVIFITSIIFLYTLLVPSLRTDLAEKTVVEGIRTELIEKISSDLTILAITINGVGGETCLQLVDLSNEAGINGKIVIQNNQGQIFTPYISSDGRDIYVDRTENPGSNFLKISVSEEFSLVSSTPPSCTASEYSVGLIRTEKNVFESKIVKTLEEYGNDYDILKGELSVPRINEFGFGFIYENRTAISTADPNLSISVYSERTPIRYIDMEGNKKSGDLEIRVW